MRRFIKNYLIAFAFLGGTASQAFAQDGISPSLRTLKVPAAQTRGLATKLSIQYRDVPGVQIAPDVPNQQLVIMAPKATQAAIATQVKNLLTSQIRMASARSTGPMRVALSNITWREFEDSLQSLTGGKTPVTTTRNGERAAFQLTATPLQGTTVEVDRRSNSVTVVAPEPSMPGWQQMISSLDRKSRTPGEVMELLRIENAEPEPIQRALNLLRRLESSEKSFEGVQQLPPGSPFRNAVFQEAAGQATQPAAPQQGLQPAEDGGAGVIGDTQIQFVPELGTIIIRGAKRDVERVMDVIKQIEEQSKITKPDIEVVDLQHADANAVAELLQQLYEDVLSARQGEVSITSLDSPNALLLIGRTEAINGLKELIEKIDQPVAATSRLRVFRLQNASAVDAETTIRDFFTDRPGGGDDLRPAIGPRVRVLADYRTNSLIISASPRDMTEVTRLINDLDAEKITAQSQIKIFPLNNAVAEDLAPVLQEAINGEGDGGNDNITAPSTALSIVAVDADKQEVIDSGILAGAVVTADTNSNSVVVRAPAASMALIAELVRQLDKAPGIDSLVKVFTIQNGDAAQLVTELQNLFGDDAGTSGTSIGAGNLPDTTAGESSLVPLRFSADLRTNSIVASGGAADLDVVESILLRLDSEGFAERITEVIWLRHQAAVDVATAIQTYVQQRTQTVNTIQQFQQGLGPFDLPDRDLIVVAEPVSNSVLLSVSPRLYPDVRRIIDKLDRRPPMVLIKVLLAEVKLADAFEIGGEVGLQDSLLFDRGVAATPLNNSLPGFDFNNVGLPNNNLASPDILAAQGITSFGVGQASSTLGYGGFVLSAASDSINLLLRTLQDAERLQILSRPQIMTMDNTEGRVEVGETVARVTGLVFNNNNTQTETADIDVGLIMQVRPRVGSDGLIVMDIDATRSKVDDNSPGTPIGTDDNDNVISVQNILKTTAQSTVAAYSGQTVIFGGLIQKIRQQRSQRVPFISDIPLIGNFFKYDSEVEERNELLVIMTPMLVTGEEDLEYVKATESSRMSWCLADVVEAHGDVGLSGGYGLWGPAVGQTIYPDLQPTVEGPTQMAPILEQQSEAEELPTQSPPASATGLIEGSYFAPTVVTPPGRNLAPSTRANNNAPVIQSPTDQINLSQRGGFPSGITAQPVANRSRQGNYLPGAQATTSPEFGNASLKRATPGITQFPSTQQPGSRNAAMPQAMAPQIWTNQTGVPKSNLPVTSPDNSGSTEPQRGFTIPPASQASWMKQATGEPNARQTSFNSAAAEKRMQPTRLGQ
jgi:general secretion pathway protein D